MTKTNGSINLLNLPDVYVDFQEQILASCALPNKIELLDQCKTYIEHWFEHRYSIHALANWLAAEQVSLWTADDVPVSRDNDFCFYMSFEKQNGSVLIQCQIEHKARWQ